MAAVIVRSITDVQADIAKLSNLWSTATQQYEARKAGLAAELDAYIASHQTAANSHSAEIQAAQALKSVLVPAAAGVEILGADVEQFLLTQPWYQRLVANIKRNARWYLYGSALMAMLWVIFHVHR